MTPPALSLVVLAHDMARALPRTLRSLAPDYQATAPVPPAEIGGWEIIVVDNGSACPVQAAEVAPPDVALRVIRRGPEAAAAVAEALNQGLQNATGEFVGVWIDGARLASPGLLGACARALRLHPRAVVATRNYHLGPALQHAAAMSGFDAAAEDRLLNSIDWPRGAARLAEIATPEQPDPTGPLLESNALFMRRAQWQALGGFDPRFGGAGGGAVNIDMLLRACAAPGSQLIRILGEGTFHQLHGGVTTGAGPRRAAALLKLGSKQYFRLRGRPMRALRQRGWLYDAALGALRPDSPERAHG
ncbi:hypothetical protein BKE38_11085 [Pseudoroseomonas deserti]|uniref:Glycosyltransferase 2-like domain-containing protein n=1 Tax=Teichococcus deserti TaxID=1817963 RepID=A0A1V2H2Q1_9PROT|nr:glycosyltransferase family A protein [Pseudoroseomonas deserti]ONG54012.1 hypothetical protein BKE38_11085 [Pseudoroseomonas deserti]